MLKRLRADGYSVRYICAGEHGEKKGRSHWHCVFFFAGKVPQVDLERRIDWEYWNHGFSYFQTADYKGFYYLLKYTLKDQDNRAAKKRLRLSKYPPIGAVYFADLAERMAEGGFAMHSPEYSFQDCQVRSADGVYRPRKFWLWDRSRELFLEKYVSAFGELHGREPPMTEFLWEEYFDPIARRERMLDRVDMETSIARKAAEWQAKPRERVAVTWAELRGILLLPGEVKGLVSRYSDGSARLVLGDRRFKLESGPSLAVQFERCGLGRELVGQAVDWVEAMPVGSRQGD